MSAGVIELFEELNRDGLTIIVVTHTALPGVAQKQIELLDGRIAPSDKSTERFQPIRH